MKLALLFLALTTLARAAIGLSWQDNSNNESGFEIHRSTDSVNFALIATTARNATAYTDETAQAGVTYHYRVRAVNSAGASAYSGTAIWPPRGHLSVERITVGTLVIP